jgi:uncharacterized protein YndB with AHSA1/START domain
MTTKEFSIGINAAPDKIWFALWDDYHYRQWTSVFCEGSYMETDWKEGGRVHFLAPNGEGMYSLLEENKPNELMYFRHIGEIKDFKEQPLDEVTGKWSGSREYYSLLIKESPNVQNVQVVLNVLMDIDDHYLPYFEETFPKGLSKVKELAENFRITIKAEVEKPVAEVWERWTSPVHIVEWTFASDDWHAPRAENELKVGGKFMTRMEAKDGSFGFDFWGVYDRVELNREITYSMGDGRKAAVRFESIGNHTSVIESFEAEGTNSLDLQRDGWQAILNNFKKYCEGSKIVIGH